MLLLSTCAFAQDDLNDFALKRQEEGSKFEKKRKINIYSILFATNSAILSDKDKQVLQNQVIPYILRFPPSALITVEGHTDNTGKDELNQALSKARADSVLQFLVYQGIDSLRLASAGYGESQPIATNKSEEGRKRNRRVTMKIEHTGTNATIHTKNGNAIAAKYMQYENDGTISYSKSDTDPITKIQQSNVKYVKYPDGSTYDPNTQTEGTVKLKNGREIPARIISQEVGFVSYKTSETSPVVRVKNSEVQSIKYLDGREVVVDTEPVVQGIASSKGAVGFKGGQEVEAFSPRLEGNFVTYQTSENGSPVKVQKSKVHYIKHADGSVEYISTTNPVANNLNFKWLNKLIKLTRVSAFVDLGVVPLNVKKSDIDFTYIDESPSRDNMRTQINLEPRYIAYGGQIGLEWETDRTITWRTYYQYAVNSEGSTKAFGVGLGKIIGKRANTRIGADLQFGSASVKLGNLQQNDEFIQVNESRFYSDYVKMRYRNYFVAINPYVSFERPLANGLSLRLKIGAGAGLHTKSNVTFKGQDAANKKVKGKEKLTANNVSFILDGEKTTNAKLFSILGPQVKLGVYYTLFSRTRE
jgi:outer membrane protein OmpA-like peptidoglycan-associated protein